jgi:hypothetical protein
MNKSSSRGAAAGAVGSGTSTGLGALYKSENVLAANFIDCLIMGCLLVYIIFMQDNASENILDWDKVPHYTITCLLFFTIISILLYIYTFTIDDPNKKKANKKTAFLIAFVPASIIIIMTTLVIMFACMVAAN